MEHALRPHFITTRWAEKRPRYLITGLPLLYRVNLGSSVKNRVQRVRASTLEGVTKELDSLLASGSSSSEPAATKLLKSALEEGTIIGFQGAQQVPKRDYTLAEVKLNKVDGSKLLAPVDNTITITRTMGQAALLAGLLVAVVVGGWNVNQALVFTVILLFMAGADQVAYRGGIEFLLLDTVTRLVQPAYSERVAWHEAGHFLIAYLVGIIPKDYTLSAQDAFQRYRAFTVQAGTVFCDQEFQQEVQSGKIESTSVDQVTCVALAGVISEYLKYGYAEGGLNDISQVDQLMRALQFSQKKVDSQVRWSLVNVATLLRRHSSIQETLARKMAAGASVGSCISTIERELRNSDFI